MQENIDLKVEAERLHTLWHEAQHALDLLRDHHKAAQEEINVYEACVKRNAEAMRRSRMTLAACRVGNAQLAEQRDALLVADETHKADAERYKNQWIELCDYLRRRVN